MLEAERREAGRRDEREEGGEEGRGEQQVPGPSALVQPCGLWAGEKALRRIRQQ